MRGLMPTGRRLALRCLLAAAGAAIAQPAEPPPRSVKNDLIELPVRGVCPSAAPQGSRAWGDGQIKVVARAWPTEPAGDAKTLRNLRDATRHARAQLPPALLAAGGSEAEAKVRAAMNDWLAAQQVTERVERVSLTRSAPVCAR